MSNALGPQLGAQVGSQIGLQQESQQGSQQESQQESQQGSQQGSQQNFSEHTCSSGQNYQNANDNLSKTSLAAANSTVIKNKVVTTNLTTPSSNRITMSGSSSIVAKYGASSVSPSTQCASIESPVKAPILNDYLDYRLFLNDYYEYRKDQSRNELRGYSYAVFSAAADIKSPNYLKMIIEGKRNLSGDMVGKFARAMQLTKDQTEELALLVQLTQASEPALRNHYLRELSEYRVAQKLRSGELDQKTYDKIPSWVGWILYAMIDQNGVEFNTPELKKLLRGKAAISEIEDALNVLLRSGEVVRDDSTGNIKKAKRPVMESSAEEIPAVLIRKLQAQLMYLGLESLFQDPPTDREFGTLTLSLTKTEFEHLRFQLRKFRKEVHKDQSTKRMNSKGDRIYQLNLQLFPVTDEKKSTEKGLFKTKLPEFL